MLSELKERIIRRLKTKREIRPLVSSKNDLELVKKVKGRKFPCLKQFGHIKRILSAVEKKIIFVCVTVIIFGSALFVINLIINGTVSAPAVGGRYMEAIVGSPQLVNPIFSNLNDVDTDLTRLIYSGLMRHDKNQKLARDLAASYEISEDKKIYIFKLRQDVKWHDGSSFTARDVIFTFQTIQDKAVGSPLYVAFQGVGIEALDEYTVRFNLKEPFAPFLSSLTVGILQESGWSGILPDRMRLHKQNLQPIGTGPFMFKKLTKDDSGYIHTYELERFADYYNQPPHIKEFVFKFFSDYEGVDGSIQALRGQRVSGMNFVPNSFRDKVERKHINLHILQLPQYTALFFNQENNTALKDGKVRIALEYAIDKNRILREVLKNDGQIIYSPLLPGFPGYNPEIAKTEYSVEKANALLDEKWPRILADDYRAEKKDALMKSWQANYSASSTTSTINIVNEDGSQTTGTLREFAEKEIDAQLNREINEAQVFYRKDKDGNYLDVNLVTANTPEYQSAAKFIAGFWQEVGIKVNIEFVEAKDISRNALKNRKYDILLYGMILSSDPDQFPFWHSSQIDFPGLNLARYVNRNVDALLEKAREIDNEDEKAELYKKFQDIIINERPAVFLYIPTYTYAATDDIKGIDVVRIFTPADRFANVTEWYIKTKREWK